MFRVTKTKKVVVVVVAVSFNILVGADNVCGALVLDNYRLQGLVSSKGAFQSPSARLFLNNWYYNINAVATVAQNLQHTHTKKKLWKLIN